GARHGDISGRAQPGAEALRVEEEGRRDFGEDFPGARGSSSSAVVMAPYLMNITLAFASLEGNRRGLAMIIGNGTCGMPPRRAERLARLQSPPKRPGPGSLPTCSLNKPL